MGELLESSRHRRRPLLDLGTREAHVWYLSPDAAADPRLARTCEALLSADERERRLRFRFAKGRQEYLAAHALLRAVLSRYVAVSPRVWTFETNAHGRPEIAYPRRVPPLRFNLSHTDGLVACAVTLGRPIGVDLEDTRRRGSTAEVAERFFAPSEVAALRALRDDAQRERFFEYWTLKESYIKARGDGLSLPLDGFAFHLEDSHPVRISFDPRLRDDPTGWQFALFRPTARHVMAVGVWRGLDSDFVIRPLAVDATELW